MKILILAVLICCSFSLHAQYKQPYFNTITVDDGLPQETIVSTLEDKYGYLWFGTYSGLVRYDGYRLKPYQFLNQDGLPISPAQINIIFEDSKGKLWVYVFFEGIYFYDRTKDQFIKVPFNKEEAAVFKKITPKIWKEDKQRNSIWMICSETERNNKTTIYSFDLASSKLESYNDLAKGNHFIPSYTSADISIDASGKAWLVSDSLLSYFEPASKSFKPYFVLPDPSGKQFFSAVIADPVDKELLWINIGKPSLIVPEPKIDRKLILFNTKTKTYKISAPGSKDPTAIPGICFHTIIDSLKRVWLSTDKGIALYNPKTGAFTNYPIIYKDKTNHTEVITANKDGNIWISGINSELFFLDTKKDILYPYKQNDGLGSLPAYRYINKIFFDRSGTLWLNMPNTGIAWLNRQKTQFSPLPINPFPKAIGSKELSPQFSIVGKQGDSICFLADTSSLVAWNTLKNSFEKIDLKEKQLYKNIISVAKSSDGNLWIGAQGNGLIQYNPLTLTINKFIHDPNNKNTIASTFVYTVAVDKAGLVWLGTDKGLNSYNPQSKNFVRYPYVINNGSKQVKDSLDDQFALSIYIDKEEIIWIGTGNGGVNSYNSKKGKFRSYLNYKEGFFAITSMFEDSRKRLWVTTYVSGVYLLNKQTGALKRFTEKEGLIYNSALGISEDATGNIWVATSKGMSRINPVTYSITNFTAARPVSNEFIINNFLDRNGIFHLQARNGILAFNPLKLDETKTLPLVYIESFGYRPAGESSDTLVFTEGKKKINLSYNENRISFQYIALHFADASSNQYAYQLEGYDKDWIQAGTQRSVIYTNLSPGTYTFKVKAANSYGEWNETGANFTVTIMPAWWNTWWAYIIYALLFLAGLRAFSMYRERRLRSEKEILEEKVMNRTNALQKSLNDLQLTQKQLIQSEKMASLGELTAGIAHEIQNPLNFVNNFSEVNKELLAEMNDELAKGNIEEAKSIAKDVTDNEEKIIFHGKRADSIVKGMLQHSRATSSVKEPTDINALCDEYLRLSYHGLRAKDKSFNATFKTDFDTSIGKVNIVSQDVGRVILNLLTNAFYAVGEKSSIFNLQSENQKVENLYTPTVSVSTKKLDNTTEIRVTDNGGGIPQKVVEKIFQPFFTTKPTGQGTGLGLSLSYDIITKGHGGTLTVETKEGEGSTFIIHLPE